MGLRGGDLSAAQFESVLSLHLPKTGRLLLAVSGGADSMALLSGCLNIRPQDTYVLTVDHGLRETSARDAAFVEAYCASRSCPCAVKTLGDGAVAKTASLRGRGVEDAARLLRYQALEEGAAECGAKTVVLAHTRNDQLETVLYRFLQGTAARVMEAAGPVYLRPMLDLRRSDVESYLKATGTPHREDETNGDPSFLRNRVRKFLVPLLDEQFPGWGKAVLAGAEKAGDNAALAGEIARALKGEEAESGVLFLRGEFFALPRSVRRELVYRTLAELGVKQRTPYGLVRRVMDGKLPLGTKEWVAEKKGDRLLIRPTRPEEGWKRHQEKNRGIVF